MKTKILSLRVPSSDLCKRLQDPTEQTRFHFETFLPFSEAAKLERGNANVRPPSEKKKPFKDMILSAEEAPGLFHIKNRGITYTCDSFSFENKTNTLSVKIPSANNSDEGHRYGIADGGHTHEVIRNIVSRINELREDEDWEEPYVRVHFVAGKSVVSEIDEVVEALNTSTQVQQYTLDEYQNQFEELKKALKANGFDPSLVAFRENEDDKDWDVREVIQRMACFLKDRWRNTPPALMYRSKGKALDLYSNDDTRKEFRKLYGVIVDIVTFPEYVESQFSRNDLLQGKKFGKLRAVKTLKNPHTRSGTKYESRHQMHLAASLPIASAFRDLLQLKGNQYHWSIDPKKVFERCAGDLYDLLKTKGRTQKTVTGLASDNEYWTQASLIVARTKSDILLEN